jgi:hypothetical protein
MIWSQGFSALFFEKCTGLPCLEHNNPVLLTTSFVVFNGIHPSMQE